MDKAQAIHQFWSGFGLMAYDQSSVPQDASLPYITYEVITGNVGQIFSLSASLWYHSTSWKEISEKADEIAQFIGYGYQILKVDGGYLWVTQGSPFAQRITDEDSHIRRIYINLSAEFLTAY